MEAAVSASASPMKAINFLATSTTPRPLTNPTTFPPWPPTKPNSISLYSHPRNTPGRHGLTRCSTAPNSSGTDFDTGKNPSFGTNSSPKTPNPPIPISGNEASSSSSLSSVGMVFDLGPTGSWDCAEIGSPVVKRFLSDEEERWYMWYFGRSDANPSSDCIGVAVSSNGVHWERGTQGVRSNADVGLVMDCSNDWWAFDTKGIRPGEVMIMSSSMVRASSSVYWLYYTGYNSEKVEESMDGSLEFKLENPEIGAEGKIFKSLPGLAMSQDGRHWARIEGDHHSGALFDVGSEGDWDSMFIAAPQVVFHSKGDLRMYYHSFDSKTRQFAIGVARSRDGMKWLKLGKITLSGGERGCFDEHGMMNGHVIKNRKNGKYVMAYEGVGGGGVRSIGLAESSDGLRDWRKVRKEAILNPAEGGDGDGWDSKGVGSPCLVQMDGEVDEWRVYYRGVGIGGRTGIGMAVCQGTEFRSFRRWSGFHL